MKILNQDGEPATFDPVLDDEEFADNEDDPGHVSDGPTQDLHFDFRLSADISATWECADGPTQLISIWIFVCQHTNLLLRHVSDGPTQDLHLDFYLSADKSATWEFTRWTSSTRFAFLFVSGQIRYLGTWQMERTPTTQDKTRARFVSWRPFFPDRMCVFLKVQICIVHAKS